MGALNRETIISIVLLLFCGFLIWSGQQIRIVNFGELEPRTWPLAVSYVLTGFCLIYFFQAVTGKIESFTEEGDDNPEFQGIGGFIKKYTNPIICFALYFAFLYTLPFFGTLIGGTLLVFSLLTVLGGITPGKLVLHAVIAVVSVGAMWSIFTFALRVILPRGEIIPSVMGPTPPTLPTFAQSAMGGLA